MRLIRAWARRSNARAVDNARVAATDASRRLLEAAEVAAYVEGLAARTNEPPVTAEVAHAAR
jgi:hypothetical protein